MTKLTDVYCLGDESSERPDIPTDQRLTNSRRR